MRRLVLCGVAVDEYDADDAPCHPDHQRPELRTGAPLHHAITKGSEPVVRELLGGADIERMDRVVTGGKKGNVDALGLRPLARAALLGRDGVVRVLLEHGADHAALSNGQRRAPLCCGCAGH